VKDYIVNKGFEPNGQTLHLCHCIHIFAASISTVQINREMKVGSVEMYARSATHRGKKSCPKILVEDISFPPLA
jgi:hypothetical protein